MLILGLDIGYGSTKCILMENDQILKKFKIESVIGITQKNSYIKDSRTFEYKEHSYYVGEDALSLPSENLIDITEYKNLAYYAPLFIAKVLKILETDLQGKMPDILVSGLSKAQIQFSGHFREAISSFDVNECHYEFPKIYIIPQGAGSKLCIDKYGRDFPNPQREFTGNSSYIGVDIGFSTLDMFRVVDGKTSASVFEGIEHEGIMKIASKISQLIKEKHNREISLHEAKEILDTGIYKLRSNQYDYKSDIDNIKKEYIINLMKLIETKYGKILDKCDFIFLSGGGSAFFNSAKYEDNEIRVPKSNYEYYNALGMALFGLERSKLTN